MSTTDDSLRIAVIGTGVIGAAWVSGFLTAGHTVTAFDPAEGAEDRLRSQLTAEASAAAESDRFRFALSLADAVSDADFVQENGPERLEIKQSMLADIAEAAPPDRDHRLLDIRVRPQ
jgi:carnitine 3-dehydrogenase